MNQIFELNIGMPGERKLSFFLNTFETLKITFHTINLLF